MFLFAFFKMCATAKHASIYMFTDIKIADRASLKITVGMVGNDQVMAQSKRISLSKKSEVGKKLN